MTAVVFIRHGPTPWNAEGRIQGQTDVALDDFGRAEVARWRLPSDFRDYEWTASPLARTRETAELLGLRLAALDARLLELDWGDWEGRTWVELRGACAPGVREYDAGGLDFRPPCGENRRSLLARVQDWLAEAGARARPIGAITHRGVIHAALALATGWDMTGVPPQRLDWASAHLFRLDTNGALCVERLNVALVEG